jgi:hypothetical protein
LKAAISVLRNQLAIKVALALEIPAVSRRRQPAEMRSKFVGALVAVTLRFVNYP